MDPRPSMQDGAAVIEGFEGKRVLWELGRGKRTILLNLAETPSQQLHSMPLQLARQLRLCAPRGGAPPHLRLFVRDGCVKLGQLFLDLRDFVLEVEEHAIVQGFEFAVDGAEDSFVVVVVVIVVGVGMGVGTDG